MKQVFGKYKVRILNIPVGRAEEQDVHASLCLTFTDRRAFDAMAASVGALKLPSVTLGEKLLQRMKLTSPFWSTRSPYKGLVHLEKIVYRMNDNQIESSGEFLRFRWEWGFNLNDLILRSSST
jgi:hypothetical protein